MVLVVYPRSQTTDAGTGSVQDTPHNAARQQLALTLMEGGR